MAQTAPPPRLRSQVEAILGPAGDTSGLAAKSLRIIWVWGDPDGHPSGSHCFAANRDLSLGLFRTLPNVAAEPA